MNFEEIKRNYSVYDVAVHKLGLELTQTSSGEYRGVSPSPGPHNTNDALSISGDMWHDFSTGEGGSVLDLVAYVKFGATDTHSILEAAKFLSGNSYDSAYWVKRTAQRDNFCVNVAKWHEALLKDSQTLDYLHGRGITDETIEKLGLGLVNEYIHIGNELVQEWRLSCPYLDAGGKPIYMASRSLPWAAHEGSPKYHKLKQNEFLKNSLFGLNTIPLKDSECDILFVGEGMFDGISLIQAGYPVLFTIGGAAGKNNDAILLQQARRFRRIITAFDIDINLSGQRFTVSYGKKFLREKLNFSCVTGYGEGHKDVSDFYAAGGNVQELIDSAMNGYEFMSRFTFWENTPRSLEGYHPFYSLSANEKTVMLGEVKKFVHELKRFLPEIQQPSFFGGDMQHVIDALRKYYPPEIIAKFNEPLTAREVLFSMRDEFLDGRHVFFNGSIKGGSYYEYQPAGYWAQMTDADMQGEISAHFRHDIENKTVAQLTTQVRLVNNRNVMPKFNRKRLWLFQNGVFDFDTGELREPKPDDYLSWQVGYSYDAEAECPTFDKFMAECAENEPSRIALLTDLLGYIPYENNRLEKIFVLIGEGQNGKSTFCKVLEYLVASVNERANSQSVTNIQPNTFDKGTELIQLENSVLNITADIDYDLRGCESALKSLASGDTISGNYKFHDTRSFTPRCKLIMTSNRMVRVSDDSYGLRRKLMFIRFAHDFTGNEDTHLTEKLKAELPGIFNKMCRAYKALLEREKELGNRAIRPCIDQEEFMSEFTQTVSPVAAFWAERKEEYIGREVKKATIFDDFKEYCERNGRFAGAENSFYRSLLRVACDDGITIENNIKHKEGEKQVYYIRFNPPAVVEPITHETTAQTTMNESETAPNNPPADGEAITPELAEAQAQPATIEPEITAPNTGSGIKWEFDASKYNPDEPTLEQCIDDGLLELEE